MSRFILFLFVCISFAWIIYATYDHTNQHNKFHAESLFGADDEQILILQNTQQAQSILQQFVVHDTLIAQLLQQLNWEMINTIYIAQKRGHILIKTDDLMTQKTAKKMFVSPKNVKLSLAGSISYGQVQGRYAKNMVYFYTKNFPINKKIWNKIQFDKNSDAVLLSYRQKRWAICDVYVKKNGIIEYRSEEGKPFFGKKVNDQELFAQVVPANIDSYQFYESDYLRTFDTSLLNGPLNNWIKYGLVHLTINGKHAIITDYVETVDPMEVLSEFYKQQPSDMEAPFYIRESTLTDLLPSAKGLYVFPINEFVVFSDDASVCENILADYTLGHTLVHDLQKTQEIYGDLPQKVNYRNISASEKTTLSLYQRTHLSTVIASMKPSSTSSASHEKNAFSYVVGYDIADFFPFNAQLFVLTKQNKVVFFEDDQKKWEHQIDKNVVGTATMMDIYANDKKQLLVATETEVYLFDKNGNQVQGFPIHLEDGKNIQMPVFYRWQGNGFFVLTTQHGRLMLYDQQGRELTFIASEISEYSQKPLVWTSANQPFIGVFNSKKFEMIHAQTQKQYRVFDASNVKMIIREPNEIKLVQQIGNHLAVMNQKGQTLWQQPCPDGQLISTLTPNLGIVIRQKNQLRLFNANGFVWATILLPFSELADVQLFSTESGLNLIATVDAIENKIYLWKMNGELYRPPFNGSRMVRYDNGNLYTIIDNLVVKYPL